MVTCVSLPCMWRLNLPALGLDHNPTRGSRGPRAPRVLTQALVLLVAQKRVWVGVRE